jgi:hypothetical protein
LGNAKKVFITGKRIYDLFSISPSRSNGKYTMKKPSLALALILTASACFGESPLDAPGEKKITVATEISRGAKEVLRHSREHGSLDLLILAKEMQTVLAENNAINRDSPGFLLGARLMQWYLLDMFLHHEHVSENNSPNGILLARELAGIHFRQMRAIQKSLKISDTDLCDALGLERSDAEIHALMRSYDAETGIGDAPAPPRLSTPLPDLEPMATVAPEFVRLKDYFTLVNARGREIKTLEPGKRLRVVSRSVDKITIDYLGESFSIPANVTESVK